MIELLPGLAINSSDEDERTPPISFRRILATLFAQTAPGVPIAGRIPAGPSDTPLLVSGHASAMKYVVPAGWAVTTRDGKGAYIIGLEEGGEVDTSAAHATLPRIDRIYIVQPDPELTEVGKPRIDVAVGTAAASPALPDLPAGALELGRKTVAAGATNTTSGAAITNIPPLVSLNLRGLLAANITDQQNINAGRVNGVKVTSSNTATPPVSPTIGDVWYDWS